MTTIAFKDGVMASDSQESEDDFKWPCWSQKLYRVRNLVVGGCGDSSVILHFLAWLDNGKQPEAAPQLRKGQEFGALVWDGKDLALVDEGFIAIPVDCPCFAIGSGRDFAMGAMMAGASAEDAVRIAMQLDRNSGGDVQIMTTTP